MKRRRRRGKGRWKGEGERISGEGIGVLKSEIHLFKDVLQGRIQAFSKEVSNIGFFKGGT